MIKLYTICLCFFLATVAVNAQTRYFTKDGHISFYSHALIEDIKADNHQVLSVIDTESRELAIQLLMRSFTFKKALMREHFNENYVESHIYPKAKFTGRIAEIKLNDTNPYETEISGTLSIHGVEKEVSTKAQVRIEADKITLSGDFNVVVADYNIKIPALVRDNIAKIVKVSFELHHKPYK
ncbi:YceI family protein [Leptobacterium flavescens]|uniref:YceI family protein n=1 Tax=Leptobacterium flavescens TaxID=472055 RepID=A0A6P0UNH7_9FLAO|nr:YceI family protein [Leptobacterium flavescens]NER13448.1 YceI family protein [Leptobacterium flavescens]